jgi:hypothetical protein
MSTSTQAIDVRYSRVRLSATCVFAVTLSFLGCALAGDSVAARQTEIIKWLRTAEQVDLQESKDPSVGPARRADLAGQAAKADLAIRKLQHGYPVPQSEIEEASEIPPKSVRVHKDQLLAQLEQVRQDELRDARLTYEDDPVGVNRAIQEEAQTADVIEKLEIG